ncbi:hypothetical protein [Paenibacillus selenitireducens]|nr:hypothetical protein [Paenibacillus selenitireducens]
MKKRLSISISTLVLLVIIGLIYTIIFQITKIFIIQWFIGGNG